MTVPDNFEAYRSEFYDLMDRFTRTRQYVGAGKYELPTAQSMAIAERLGDMEDAHPEWAEAVLDLWSDDQRMNPENLQ